jgi:hypothetical protein
VPDLVTEMAHLELADRHIEQAHSHIAKARARIATSTALGRDLGEALTSLETIQATLAAFEAHRALIVRTIEDVRAGKI